MKNLSKKSKIIIIVSSVIVGLIALIVLFSFTLFAVRKVEVDYKSSTLNLTATQQEIVENSGIKQGGSVFFQKKSKFKNNLEKKYPYIKVVNIETVFPSKLVLHIVERSEIYAFEHDGLYYICDNEFKILRITDSFVSEQDNAILVGGVIIKDGNYAVCDKLPVKNFVDIYEKLYQNNRTISEQRAIIKEINFSLELDEVYKKETLSAELKLFDGQTYKIKNCERGLAGKTKLFIDVYSQVFNFIGKDIKLKDGTTITLTEEILLDSVIEINNFYDYTAHQENDCYFDIIPN